ncbi:MAG: hypothetical protein IPQ18_14805 [Saprospiraceae bacterium]|nr:hypothetical protein [Saprospiraceae bacterium]
MKSVLIGDDTRLRQVLINLVGNSIKFTQEGNITSLMLKLYQNPDTHQTIFLLFEVTDTGIGMSPDSHR